jgi:hypothetical protein
MQIQVEIKKWEMQLIFGAENTIPVARRTIQKDKELGILPR